MDRYLIALSLVACTASEPAVPATPGARLPDAEPAVANRGAPPSACTPIMPAANVVVVGRCGPVTTRDGHLGHIEVEQVLRGAAGFGVRFVSAPDPIDVDERRVYFLTEEPGSDAMRALPLQGRISAPLDLVARLEAETCPPPAPGPQWASDLSKLRAHDQSDWSPAAEPSMRLAARVFSELAWVGRSTAELDELLGPPLRRRPAGDAELWEYAYHNGVAGTLRWMKVRDGRVVSMHVVRTQ